MSRLNVALLVAALAAVSNSGCGNAPAQAPPVVDPVASYRAFLVTEIASLTKKPDIVFDENTKIDVQKTDSLISPYLGSCIVKVANTEHWSEGKVTVVLLWNVEMTHGMQNNKWVMTRVKGKLVHSEVAKDDTEKKTTAAFLKKLQAENQDGSSFALDSREGFVRFLEGK